MKDTSSSTCHNNSHIGLPDDYPMVMFAEDWGAHPSSSQHLARELSKYHDITWVNSIGLRAPDFSMADISRLFSKLKALVKVSRSKVSVSKSDEFIWQPEVVNPLALPFHGQGWVRWLNQKLLKNKLSHVFKTKHSADLIIEKPILWISLPSAESLLGQINECFSIYYCGDDFTSLEGVDHDVMGRLESELIKKVDLILVASEQLAKKFPKEKTIFIPHGVADYFFEQPKNRPKDLPEGKPIAGFYGSISGWLDQALMTHAARMMPHWNFVFIGPKRCATDQLDALPNVYFLGEKAHKDLPSYVNYWQVSLLPFKDNAQIRACNPLKLREYLAIGKPIVTTYFPALKPYKEWVSAVNVEDRDCFCKAIECAGGEVDNQNKKKQERINQVSNHSWKARAIEIEREILERIQNDKINNQFLNRKTTNQG